MRLKIRFVEPGDCDALLALYAQYIDTAVTFETVLPSRETFAQRIAEITRAYPYLVCEEKGKRIGYAYAHRHMQRDAYQWNAELSVYLDRDFTGQGIGKKLYLTLMELLKVQGIKTVYAGVTIPNEKSEKLHATLGFTQIGVYHNAGYKAGQWRSVSWFEKQISPYNKNPLPFRPLCEFSRQELERILQNIKLSGGCLNEW